MNLYMWHGFAAPEGETSLIALADSKEQAKEIILFSVKNRPTKALVKEYLDTKQCFQYREPTGLITAKLIDMAL